MLNHKLPGGAQNLANVILPAVSVISCLETKSCRGFLSKDRSCTLQGQNPAGVCARFRPFVDEWVNILHAASIALRIPLVRTSALEVVALERCHSSFFMVQWKVIFIVFVCSVVWDTGFNWGGCEKGCQRSGVRQIDGCSVYLDGGCSRGQFVKRPLEQNSSQMCLTVLQ